MAQTKAKREAIALIVKDLQNRVGAVENRIRDNRRAMQSLANAQAVAKRERSALYELIRKIEDGLIGPLGRWCGECQKFGEHYPRCRFAPASPEKAKTMEDNK